MSDRPLAGLIPSFPKDHNEAHRRRWRACRREAEHRESARKEIEWKKDEARALALMERAREIVDAGLKVPNTWLGRRVAYLAACVELGQHASIDDRARPHIERMLLDFEAQDPDARDVSWWHALDGHQFSLDDVDGRCTCGASMGRLVTTRDLVIRARQLWDAGFGMQELDAAIAAGPSSTPAPKAAPAAWGRT